MNRRQSSAALASMLAAATLPGCATAPATPPAPPAPPAPAIPLNVISFGGGFNLPLWAARERGLFAANGLAATLHTPDISSPA
jgi:ABC-type nitrate/sulfonate/bicarbonate transport system substrate-binding protein